MCGSRICFPFDIIYAHESLREDDALIYSERNIIKYVSLGKINDSAR